MCHGCCLVEESDVDVDILDGAIGALHKEWDKGPKTVVPPCASNLTNERVYCMNNEDGASGEF